MAGDDSTQDLHFVPAPCQVACPVGTDAPSYIGLIWEGKYEEAFEAITVTNPFSSICGRVCDAPCEPACRRVESDGALQIRFSNSRHELASPCKRFGLHARAPLHTQDAAPK